MKLKGMRLFAATACMVMMGIAACHSQKEITNADGTKTKLMPLKTDTISLRKDAMMQGDTMKRDH